MHWDATTRDAFVSTEVTHLHLLRHGRVRTGGRRLAYGHHDLPLSAPGRRQSRLLQDLCEQLPRADGVITSDLGRALELATPLAHRLGLPLVVTPGLREQHMGAWEGRAWEDLTAEDLEGTRAYWASYLDTAPPEGESYRDMAARVTAWLRERWDELRGGRWLVATHAGVIRALCCELMGLPLDQALRWVPAHGSHTHLSVAEAGSCLEVFGELPDGAARLAPGTPPRVSLSGSAGTGKTTLGRALAARLGVPFVEEGMRRRLEGGLDRHTLDHEGFRSLMWELWEEQIAAEQDAVARAGGFVADRSSIDFAAFWLHYRFTDDPGETDRFLNAALAHHRTYDRIVLLPWGAIPYEQDGIRSSNPWVQRLFQATVEGMLAREVDPRRLARLPAFTDLQTRVAWVLDDLA